MEVYFLELEGCLFLKNNYICNMANKYTAHPIPDKKELENLYFTQMKTQTEIGKYYGVSQKMIFSWFNKLSIKSRVAKKRNQFGKNNSSWKGDDVTYAAFHKRVESQRGRPNYCTVCGKIDSDTRFEWANLTGNYQDVSDYERMCRSCHRKYDKNRPNSSKHVRKTAK